MYIDYSLPDDIELICEKEIGILMKSIGIDATIKTDRTSLPYNHEMKFKVYWKYSPFQDRSILRSIIKELLINDILKLRYYVLIEKVDEGCIYHFRYHLRNK